MPKLQSKNVHLDRHRPSVPQKSQVIGATGKHAIASQEPPLLYSIKTLVSRTGLGRSTIYELVKSGALVAVKCGRRTAFKADDVHAWIAAMQPAIPTSEHVKTNEIGDPYCFERSSRTKRI